MKLQSLATWPIATPSSLRRGLVFTSASSTASPELVDRPEGAVIQMKIGGDSALEMQQVKSNKKLE
jgi:hypothetical protein